MLTEQERRQIDWATRNHKGRAACHRVMVGARSRAGRVKADNHFLAIEPQYVATPSVDRTVQDGRFKVKVKGQTVGRFATMGQAEGYARLKGGYVSR